MPIRIYFTTNTMKIKQTIVGSVAKNMPTKMNVRNKILINYLLKIAASKLIFVLWVPTFCSDRVVSPYTSTATRLGSWLTFFPITFNWVMLSKTQMPAVTIYIDYRKDLDFFREISLNIFKKKLFIPIDLEEPQELCFVLLLLEYNCQNPL